MTESSGFSLSTLLPFLSVALGSNNSSTSSSNSQSSGMNRAFGTAATLGLSLAILKFVVDSAKVTGEEGNDSDAHHKAVNQLLGRSEVLFQFVRTFLRNMILRDHNIKGKLVHDASEEEEDDDEEEENEPMIHKGSCHCRSVCFEVVAPRKIIYKNALPGKIQYRHYRVRARSLRFTRGEHFVTMYYVNKPANTHQWARKRSPRDQNSNKDEVGAHSFCSRCGVHILYAPNSHSTALDVNVDCLNQDIVKLKKGPGKDSKLTKGLPVAKQWDHDQENGRYSTTTTIEEQSPVAFFPPVEERSMFSGLQRHHPLLRQDGTDIDSLYDGDDDTFNTGSYATGNKVSDTPSTIYTTQTESYVSSSMSSSGVPPTLTLDTREYSNDTESVVSMNSSRSNFPPQSDKYGSLHQQSSSSLSSATGPIMRHQMKSFLSKHMASSASSSSLITPTSKSENSKITPTNRKKPWQI